MHYRHISVDDGGGLFSAGDDGHRNLFSAWLDFDQQNTDVKSVYILFILMCTVSCVHHFSDRGRKGVHLLNCRSQHFSKKQETRWSLMTWWFLFGSQRQT
jgi:hypothetical protein